MRAAVLVNFIPPYRVPVFEALQRRVGDLRIFVSTPVEANRTWPAHWGGLDVVVQRNLTIGKVWRHPSGFRDQGYVHVPYDTFQQLRSYRPDVILSGELGLRTVLSAAYKRRHPATRFVIWATLSEHTELRRGRLRRALRPWLVRQADAIIVNGASGGRYLQGLGTASERIVPVPQTIDTRLFARCVPRRNGGPLRLLFVGMLVERKGLAGFVRGLAAWAGPRAGMPVELVLAGDGPERGVLEGVALPAHVSLRFLGDQPYASLPACYEQADALVLPTLDDEWGLVVNEAMAAGLPVLGSLFSQAVQELVLEGDTGWTYMPDQPETLAAALDRLAAASPAVRRAMGERARARLAQLSPEAVAGRIAEVLGA